MPDGLLMLIVGALIGLISTIVGVIVAHILAMKLQKTKYESDLQFIIDKRKVERELIQSEFNEAMREEIRNPTAVKRPQISKHLENGLILDDHINPDGRIHRMPSGGFACFGPKMKITMADGTTKAVSECAIGESLLTIDQHSMKSKVSIICDIIKKEVDRLIVINGHLEVTETHVFYTHGFSPQRAGTLHVGKYLYTRENELEQIHKIELIEGNTIVYNILTSDDNYICIENFLVSDYKGKMATI